MPLWLYGRDSWITDERVEIRDAAHLWGQPTKETQERTRQELGDERIRVVECRDRCAPPLEAGGARDWLGGRASAVATRCLDG